MPPAPLSTGYFVLFGIFEFPGSPSMQMFLSDFFRTLFRKLQNNLVRVLNLLSPWILIFFNPTLFMGLVRGSTCLLFCGSIYVLLFRLLVGAGSDWFELFGLMLGPDWEWAIPIILAMILRVFVGIVVSYLLSDTWPIAGPFVVFGLMIVANHLTIATVGTNAFPHLVASLTGILKTFLPGLWDFLSHYLFPSVPPLEEVSVATTEVPRLAPVPESAGGLSVATKVCIGVGVAVVVLGFAYVSYVGGFFG